MATEPEAFSGLNKGFQDNPLKVNRNVLEGTVPLPVAVVVKQAVEHNIEQMLNFAASNGMNLAPHVKTTMCPKLINMQVARGVWGLTTATVHQTDVMHRIGAKRVIMANQLVGRGNMQIISDILQRDPTFEFYCIVDSVTNVQALANFFGEKKQGIRILIEIGSDGGRSGIRDTTALAGILHSLKWVSGTLLTCGVEFYEGVFETEKEIRAICKKAIDALLLVALTFPKMPGSTQELIISGAGSAWFDIVTEEFSICNRRYFQNAFYPIDSRKLNPIIRPGCYIVHDAGLYKEAELKREARLLTMNKTPHLVTKSAKLKPALKIIGHVHSRPEPTLCIVGLGKRDVAIDSDFPIPFEYARVTTHKGFTTKCPPNWKITKVMDQHAYLNVSENDALSDGDIIVFDISHPCNTFSAWRQILLVDETYNVLDTAPTHF